MIQFSSYALYLLKPLLYTVFIRGKEKVEGGNTFLTDSVVKIKRKGKKEKERKLFIKLQVKRK